MNQGKLWTVVNPTVGLPLLLGGVATIAILLHFAALTQTTWVPKFFNGKVVAATAVAPVVPAVKK